MKWIQTLPQEAKNSIFPSDIAELNLSPISHSLCYRLNFQYNFHPVGQGLFCSGVLHQRKRQLEFAWVFDCGTSSSQQLLSEQVEILRKLIGAYRCIDLLILSHFDNDHISGVCELLKTFRVKRLLLPYMNLSERLVAAFQQTDWTASSDLAQAYLRPISYFREISREAIGQIILVKPSEASAPDMELSDSTQPDSKTGAESSPVEIEWDPTKLDELTQEERQDMGIGSDESGEVAAAPSGWIGRISGLWEFIPYNEPPPKPTDANFVESVHSRATVVLGNDATARNAALDELKAVYDRQFGNKGLMSNRISLMLYAGPCYPTWNECRLNNRCWSEVPFVRWPSTSEKCSLLYGGDGYLDTEKKHRRLADFMRRKRMEKLAGFQVNHHGASGNWHAGLARKLDPEFSFFCADPNRRNPSHPHANVLKDYADHQPIIINRIGGAVAGHCIKQ